MSKHKLLKDIIKETILEYARGSSDGTGMFPVVQHKIDWGNFYQPTEQGREFWNSLFNNNKPRYNHDTSRNNHDDSEERPRKGMSDVPENWLSMSKPSQMFYYTKTVRGAVNRRRLHGQPLPPEMVEGWYRYYYKVFFGTKPDEKPLDDDKNPYGITFEEMMKYVRSHGK